MKVIHGYSPLGLSIIQLKYMEADVLGILPSCQAKPLPPLRRPLWLLQPFSAYAPGSLLASKTPLI